MDLLEKRTRSFASSLEGDFKKGTRAVVSLGEDGSASLSRVNEQMGNLSTTSQKAGQALFGLGPVGLAIAITLAVVAAALSPVVAILGGFTVGLAGALTVMTLGVGGFAALASGAVLLAGATGHLGNSLADLEDHAKKVADGLGKQVGPAAQGILGLVDQLIAPVGNLASQTLAWWGSNQRMGDSLRLVQGFVLTFLGGLNGLGVAMGKFLDGFLARGPAFQSLFGQTMQVGVRAVDGLLTNLLRLSDWFTARLPAMGPATSQIMSGIGRALQGIASASGAVVDFFLGHWPQIFAVVLAVSKVVAGFFQAVGTGWTLAQPALRLLEAAFQRLGPVIQFIRAHADSLRPVLIAVGVVAGVMLASVAVGAILTAGAVVLLVAAIVGLAAAVRAAASVVGAAFSAMGATVQRVGGQIQGVCSAVGGAFSQLGRTISGAMAGAVAAVNNLLGALGRVPGAVRAALSGIPGVSGATAALHAAGVPGFAAGGYALPGSLFRVGETGPELGYALPGGGVMITPESGGDQGGGGRIDLKTVEWLLAQNNALLAKIAGQPRLGALQAQQRVG